MFLKIGKHENFNEFDIQTDQIIQTRRLVEQSTVICKISLHKFVAPFIKFGWTPVGTILFYCVLI